MQTRFLLGPAGSGKTFRCVEEVRTELGLLDFKTDAVSERGLEAKTTKYRPQLELYATAMGAIYGKPVTRRWLHFLNLGQTVAV